MCNHLSCIVDYGNRKGDGAMFSGIIFVGQKMEEALVKGTGCCLGSFNFFSFFLYHTIDLLLHIYNIDSSSFFRS